MTKEESNVVYNDIITVFNKYIRKMPMNQTQWSDVVKEFNVLSNKYKRRSTGVVDDEIKKLILSTITMLEDMDKILRISK